MSALPATAMSSAATPSSSSGSFNYYSANGMHSRTMMRKKKSKPSVFYLNKRSILSAARRHPFSAVLAFALIIAIAVNFKSTLWGQKSDHVNDGSAVGSLIEDRAGRMQLGESGLRDSAMVACVPASNQVLSSSSSIELAVCAKPKEVSSAEPFVWGPIAWKLFHTMAAHYPSSPDEKRKAACVNFLQGLPYMLPCGDCGYHFLEQQTRGGGVTFLESACASHEALVSFFSGAHNVVNKRTKKTVWSPEQVSAASYDTARVCVGDDTVWESPVSL